jgi:hypothetical protein
LFDRRTARKIAVHLNAAVDRRWPTARDRRLLRADSAALAALRRHWQRRGARTLTPTAAAWQLGKDAKSATTKNKERKSDSASHGK